MIAKCWCGATVEIAKADKTKKCPKCGYGVRLEQKAMVYDKRDRYWYAREDTCDVCGRPMLDVPENQPYFDATLCAVCIGEEAK